jgi:dTDP-4-dehydrorhamnose reductase
MGKEVEAQPLKIPKNLGGRPSVYSPALAQKICEAVADGDALQDVCNQPGMPARRTVYYWLRTNEEFATAYELAREMRADLLADEVVKISDTEDPAKARVQIDARRWAASKLNPRRYGERQDRFQDGPTISITFDLAGPSTAPSLSSVVPIGEDAVVETAEGEPKGSSAGE